MLPAQPTVITVYLSKGGIAKSTLSALLGLFLAGLGYRVVIVDLDQQGSQSAVFDLLDEEGRSREVLHQVLKRRIDALAALTPIHTNLIPRFDGVAPGELFVIQGGPQTKIAIDDIVSSPVRYKISQSLDIVRGAIAQLSGQADFVILDMGPSEQVAALAGLVATDALLIPTTMDYLSVQRIPFVLEELDVARDVKPEIDLLGIVPVMTRYYFGGLRTSRNVQAGRELLHSSYADLLLRDHKGKPIDIPYSEDWNNVRWTGESVLTADVGKGTRESALRFARAVAERIGLEVSEGVA